MSDKSGIAWTQATWNPITGCTKVSQGCKNCYAERDRKRLAAASHGVSEHMAESMRKYLPESLSAQVLENLVLLSSASQEVWCE